MAAKRRVRYDISDGASGSLAQPELAWTSYVIEDLRQVAIFWATDRPDDQPPLPPWGTIESLMPLEFQTQQSSKPDDDAESEGGGRAEGRGATVLAGGDATPILETAEQGLNPISSPVTPLVVHPVFGAQAAQ